MAVAARAQRVLNGQRIFMEAATAVPEWTDQELSALAMYPLALEDKGGVTKTRVESVGGVHFYFGYGRNQNGPGNHSFYRRGESLFVLVTCILVTILVTESANLVTIWLRRL